MNDYKKLNIHGLPGIGVDGEKGDSGKKGCGIYFGYINDFFESFSYTTVPYLYAAIYDPSADAYSERLKAAETAYYTGFVSNLDASDGKTPSRDKNVFFNNRGGIFKEITSIYTAAGTPYSTIYKYEPYIINDSNTISIPDNSGRILVDMNWINMDSSVGFNAVKSLQFNTQDSSLFNLVGYNIDSDISTHFPFKDKNNYPTRSEFSGALQRAFEERQTAFTNDSSGVNIKKINENIGYVYYHTPFDPYEISEVESTIINSIYADSDSTPDPKDPSVPVFVNNSNITNLYKNGNNYAINVPVALKSYYKAGDILYIWKDNTKGGEKEIEYMIIVTPELEGADYNTIIANIIRIKPFSIFSSEENNGRLQLYNNFNFINYKVDPDINNTYLKNNYIYNFVKETDSSALMNISRFRFDSSRGDKSRIINFINIDKNSEDKNELSINWTYPNRSISRNYFSIDSSSKVYIDTNVYLSDQCLYFRQKTSNETEYSNLPPFNLPELTHVIAPQDIVFGNDYFLNFNFNDNYITNSKPYILSFVKSEFIKNNIDSYNIDIMSWINIADQDGSIYYTTNVKHHYFPKSEDIKCSLDFTNEILQEITGNSLYQDYQYTFTFNFIVRIFKEGISSYYSKPCYVIFKDYDKDMNIFKSVVGNTISETVSELSTEDVEIPVLFDLTQNLTWEENSTSTIIATLSNPDKYEFITNGNSNDVSIYVSNNVGDGKEFDVSTKVELIGNSLNIGIKAKQSLIADYKDVVISDISTFLGYGSEEDPSTGIGEQLSHKTKFNDRSTWATVGDKYCYIGINVLNKETQKTETYYYNIYQKGISEFRIKPKAEFKPRIKNNLLEKCNNIDNGILCNQFQYFVDVEITDFDYNTWGYLIKNNILPADTSILLDLTFTINSYSNQAQTIKAVQLGDIHTAYSTIHLLTNKKSDLENKYFKFEFDGYININPEEESLINLQNYIPSIDNIEITKDSSLRYIDISAGGNPDAVVLNMDKFTLGHFEGPVLEKDPIRGYDNWYKIPVNAFVVNDKAPQNIQSNLQNIGIYSYNTVTFKNLSIENILNDKITLRIYFEEDDPLLTYLNYSVALKESKVTIKWDSSVYTYKFNSDDFYKQHIETNKDGINYNEYICSTDNTVFVINPISLIGSNNINTYVSYTGHNMFGPSDEISSETMLYNPVWDNLGNTTYDYFRNRKSEGYLDDLIKSSIISSTLIPQKSGLQDNVKSISIDPINPTEIKNSNTVFFNLYNKESLYENIYNPLIDNNRDPLYLGIQYNSNLFRTRRQQGNTYFYYNEEEFNIVKYDQYNTDPQSILLTQASNRIQQRTDTELESIESWNYEYEISNKYNQNLVMGGILTKSGNGYIYLDPKSTDMVEKYVTDDIHDLSELQVSQNTDIITSSVNNVDYTSDNDTPDDGCWYRNLIYTAYWQYPEYVNDYILPYRFTLPSFTALEKGFINSETYNTENWSDIDNTEYKNYIQTKFGLDENEDASIKELFKKNNDSVYQFIPYNLCYQIYPRSVVNLNNGQYTSYNILMLRNPVIGNLNNSLSRPFELDGEDPVSKSPMKYKK